MYKSETFPRQQDKEKELPLPINQRANIIFAGLEENLNHLYRFIMNEDERELLNKTRYNKEQ